MPGRYVMYVLPSAMPVLQNAKNMHHIMIIVVFVQKLAAVALRSAVA
jgi:hypothetical protein